MRRWILAAVVVALCLQAPVAAAEIDLKPLRDEAALRHPLGVWGTACWSRRDDFPALVELKPSAEIVDSGVGLSVQENGTLAFHTNGRAEWGAGFDWAPMLVFKAARGGHYALGGSLKLRNAGPESDSPQVSWAVVVVGEEALEPIAQGRGGAGEQIDFGSLEALRAIPLRPGQVLGITAWRHAWHWNGGALLSGLTLELVRGRR